MPTEVVMPDIGDARSGPVTEGTITRWLKKPGDTVMRDEPLFEASTDKVDFEMPSPVTGTVGEIKVQEGTTVDVNTVICIID
jgi:pyruvate dehydrogenase E2 component (dihydrolipoamide acetyltransferase)